MTILPFKIVSLEFRSHIIYLPQYGNTRRAWIRRRFTGQLGRHQQLLQETLRVPRNPVHLGDFVRVYEIRHVAVGERDEFEHGVFGGDRIGLLNEGVAVALGADHCDFTSGGRFVVVL